MNVPKIANGANLQILPDPKSSSHKSPSKQSDLSNISCFLASFVWADILLYLGSLRTGNVFGHWHWAGTFTFVQVLR
jgi:hypothetical protein